MTRARDLYGQPWREREYVIALHYYLEHKGEPRHDGSPFLQELAQVLDRTVGSVLMRMEKAYWTSDKARLHERLADLSKTWAARAGLKDVVMDSFIVSATPYDELREYYGDGTWAKQKFADCHILFFEGTSDYDYVAKLFG